ncbi:sensor histidine kinase [Nocardiopsis sp. EMB25]|uniref:sensor histidine kinase n=1 Tax=Nocardiopsis sp. EMB25 TaxID=2835867 RepID=UPI002284E74F|nr:sensor histidine kinase [Nocardiopsis sp. EMB25]MCY9784699.1 sensor histidine kinase [Nocardiopsis sp. EMB25]
MGQPVTTGHGIRAQLNRMVLIPSITFLALFVVLSTATLIQAVSLRAAVNDGRDGIELAGALARLQEERRLSVEYLAAPGPETRRPFVDAVGSTDTALERVRDLRGSLGARDEPGVPDLADAFFTSLDEVEQTRADNLAAPGGTEDTIASYTKAVHQGIRLYASIARALDDGPASAEASAATDLMWALESFSHTDARVSAILAGDRLTREDQLRVAELAADARHRVTTSSPGRSALDADAPTASALAESDAWHEALDITDTLARHDPPITIDPVTAEQTRDTTPPIGTDGWRAAADRVTDDLGAVIDARTGSVVTAGEDASSWMLTLALGGGIVSLFAGTVAYGVAARSASRLTYRLAKLRSDTLGTARSDLPRIVRRLEAGDTVDLDTEMKQLDHGDDEVGQVADAFNIAQRTAVSAAVKQADLRAGVNRVFLGIAHRNQSLVQRQIQLLDRVEREEEDPDLLESLFQLDHLATRGRRHAENLIILGGAQPGRRWRHPIPLMDILRGAISETEEYARVRVTSVPELSLAGAAVADVIHLLAELVENATAYSPPHTEVTIATETVPKGVAVEVEDRGLGMTEDALFRANTTLSEAPEFDVMGPGTDARLGLFVVARLAHKHGVGVQLRSSPYGGTRAVVLIPSALITSGTGGGTERPRINGVARTGGNATPERWDQARTHDILAAAGGPSGRQRPLLRPVPPYPDGDTRVGRSPRGTGSPVLRRVPNLASPDADGTGAGEAEEHGHGRVGAGPDRPGLPRRRRQANLAPQLREDRGEDRAPRSAGRSPEQARQMMNAFNAGTRRGRAGDVDGSEHGSDGQVGAGTDDHTGESD